MKIYTKKGDTGETFLIGGTKVLKSHPRIECYGTIDELNSWFGVIASHLTGRNQSYKSIAKIQDRLFVIGSQLAKDRRAKHIKLPQLSQTDVTMLENEIDAMTDKLPALTSFILPGGSSVSSYCHVARCVCRRAERLVVALSRQDPVDPLVIIFLNRLSDYLFVLARFLNRKKGIQDILWTAQKD